MKGPQFNSKGGQSAENQARLRTQRKLGFFFFFFFLLCCALILSLFLGTPENAGAMLRFCPLRAPREGRGYVAPSDFVPLVGDPREHRGYVAILF